MHDQAAARFGAAFRAVLRPVPVALGSAGGGSVFRCDDGRTVNGAELSDLAADVLRPTDARYGWPARCVEWFGEAPQQILHEWNTVAHVSDYEGQPGRRPLTYDEVQALFDAADGRVEEIRARRRKGALAAMRDAAMLKAVYAFGLRRREAWGLDMVDLRHNPKVGQYGGFGALFVRYGKSSRGSP